MAGNSPNPVSRGILLLDKPRELTSMQCVEKAKAILKTRKAGHSGTLDPSVTGLMLIALDEATKAMPVLLGLDKEYEGSMRVHGDFSEDQIARSAGKFTGLITQVPPRRSAVARRERQRKVTSFEVLSVEGREVRFRTSCEAGTYIRKLCHDIGEDLGAGAHMAWLRRTAIGPFRIEEACTFDQLRSRGPECLFPVEIALDRVGFPGFTVEGPVLDRLRQGAKLPAEQVPGLEGSMPKALFALYDTQGRLGLLARLEQGRVRPERVLL